MVSITFTKDFADKVKGDVMLCDGMIAAYLISEDKVAKLTETVKKEVKPKDTK